MSLNPVNAAREVGASVFGNKLSEAFSSSGEAGTLLAQMQASHKEWLSQISQYAALLGLPYSKIAEVGAAQKTADGERLNDAIEKAEFDSRKASLEKLKGVTAAGEDEGTEEKRQKKTYEDARGKFVKIQTDILRLENEIQEFYSTKYADYKSEEIGTAKDNISTYEGELKTLETGYEDLIRTYREKKSAHKALEKEIESKEKLVEKVNELKARLIADNTSLEEKQKLSEKDIEALGNQLLETISESKFSTLEGLNKALNEDRKNANNLSTKIGENKTNKEKKEKEIAGKNTQIKEEKAKLSNYYYEADKTNVSLSPEEKEGIEIKKNKLLKLQVELVTYKPLWDEAREKYSTYKEQLSEAEKEFEEARFKLEGTQKKIAKIESDLAKRMEAFHEAAADLGLTGSELELVLNSYQVENIIRARIITWEQTSKILIEDNVGQIYKSKPTYQLDNQGNPVIDKRTGKRVIAKDGNGNEIREFILDEEGNKIELKTDGSVVTERDITSNNPNLKFNSLFVRGKEDDPALKKEYIYFYPDEIGNLYVEPRIAAGFMSGYKNLGNLNLATNAMHVLQDTSQSISVNVTCILEDFGLADEVNDLARFADLYEAMSQTTSDKLRMVNGRTREEILADPEMQRLLAKEQELLNNEENKKLIEKFAPAFEEFSKDYDKFIGKRAAITSAGRTGGEDCYGAATNSIRKSIGSVYSFITQRYLTMQMQGTAIWADYIYDNFDDRTATLPITRRVVGEETRDYTIQEYFGEKFGIRDKNSLTQKSIASFIRHKDKAQSVDTNIGDHRTFDGIITYGEQLENFLLIVKADVFTGNLAKMQVGLEEKERIIECEDYFHAITLCGFAAKNTKGKNTVDIVQEFGSVFRFKNGFTSEGFYAAVGLTKDQIYPTTPTPENHVVEGGKKGYKSKVIANWKVGDVRELIAKRDDGRSMGASGKYAEIITTADGVKEVNPLKGLQRAFGKASEDLTSLTGNITKWSNESAPTTQNGKKVYAPENVMGMQVPGKVAHYTRKILGTLAKGAIYASPVLALGLLDKAFGTEMLSDSKDFIYNQGKSLLGLASTQEGLKYLYGATTILTSAAVTKNLATDKILNKKSLLKLGAVVGAVGVNALIDRVAGVSAVDAIQYIGNALSFGNEIVKFGLAATTAFTSVKMLKGFLNSSTGLSPLPNKLLYKGIGFVAGGIIGGALVLGMANNEPALETFAPNPADAEKFKTELARTDLQTTVINQDTAYAVVQNDTFLLNNATGAYANIQNVKITLPNGTVLTTATKDGKQDVVAVDMPVGEVKVAEPSGKAGETHGAEMNSMVKLDGGITVYRGNLNDRMVKVIRNENEVNSSAEAKQKNSQYISGYNSCLISTKEGDRFVFTVDKESEIKTNPEDSCFFKKNDYGNVTITNISINSTITVGGKPFNLSYLMEKTKKAKNGLTMNEKQNEYNLGQPGNIIRLSEVNKARGYQSIFGIVTS